MWNDGCGADCGMAAWMALTFEGSILQGRMCLTSIVRVRVWLLSLMAVNTLGAPENVVMKNEQHGFGSVASPNCVFGTTISRKISPVFWKAF
jgi:hypothetical protein